MNNEKKLMIVSEETYKNVIEINHTLRELNLKPLTIVVVPMVLAEDGERISSTRIHEGKITLEGRINR